MYSRRAGERFEFEAPCRPAGGALPSAAAVSACARGPGIASRQAAAGCFCWACLQHRFAVTAAAAPWCGGTVQTRAPGVCCRPRERGSQRGKVGEQADTELNEQAPAADLWAGRGSVLRPSNARQPAHIPPLSCGHLCACRHLKGCGPGGRVQDRTVGNWCMHASVRRSAASARLLATRRPRKPCPHILTLTVG